jgi:putative transposase
MPATWDRTPNIHLWKNKHSNITVSEGKRLKELESENSKLKRLVADQQLDILVLKDIVSKKW